jgi:hypothetical protein
MQLQVLNYVLGSIRAVIIDHNDLIWSPVRDVRVPVTLHTHSENNSSPRPSCAPAFAHMLVNKINYDSNVLPLIVRWQNDRNELLRSNYARLSAFHGIWLWNRSIRCVHGATHVVYDRITTSR